MKHTNIAKVLGISEVEDLTEGYHLQPEEAASIDAFIGTANGNAVLFEALKVSAAEHEATIATMTTAATAATTLTETQAARIVELEATVLELGKKPSGNGSVLKTGTEAEETEKPAGTLPRYDSPDHPANRAAANYPRRKK